MGSDEFKKAYRERVDMLLATVLSPENVKRHIRARRKEIADAVSVECRRIETRHSRARWESAVEALEHFAEGRPAQMRAITDRFLARRMDETTDSRPWLGVAPNGSLRLVDRDDEGRPIEVLQAPAEDATQGRVAWRARSVTLAAGAPSPASGRIVWFPSASGERENLVYRSRSGHLELLERGSGESLWTRDAITERLGLVRAGCDPVALTAKTTGASHIVYRDDDGTIHELWRKSDAWTHQALRLSPKAAGGVDLYEWDNTIHSVYRGASGLVEEVYLSDQSARGGRRRWRNYPVGKRTGGSKPLHDPVGAAWGPKTTQLIVYGDRFGRLFAFEHDGGWSGYSLPGPRATPRRRLSLSVKPALSWCVPASRGIVTCRRGEDIQVVVWDGGAVEARAVECTPGTPTPIGDVDAIATEAGFVIAYRGADGGLHTLHSSDGKTWAHEAVTSAK